MAPDVALLTGVLALVSLVALVAVKLPFKVLLHRDWRVDAALGALAGALGSTNMALPSLQGLLEPAGIATAGTAVAMLWFGPVTGLVSMAIVAVAYALVHTGALGPGLACLGAATVLAYGWHVARRFADPVLVLCGLCLSLPLVLFVVGGQALQGTGLAALPWHVGLGAFVLGITLHLVTDRDRAVQTLQDHLDALQQREQEMELALEALNAGRWEWHAGRHEMRFAGHFYEDFDVFEGDPATLAQRWRALRHPDDSEKMRQLMRSALQQKDHQSLQVEFRVRDRQNHWRWLVAHGRVAERGAQGQPLRFVGVHLDVTKYRQVEESLRSSQAKYTAVYNTMPDAAGITRVSDGRYIEVNPAFCELLGLERGRVVGRTSQELDIWANPQQRTRLLQQLASDGKVDRLPMLAQRNGLPIPGLMSASPVELGGEACLVFVFHDMRSEQRTTEELVAQNSLLLQAGRLARLGAWEEVVGQGSVYWSDVNYQIHSLPADAPLPRDYVQAFVAPAWQAALRQKIHDSTQRQTGWSQELEIVRTDGRTIWARVSAEPVVEDGFVVGMRGVTLDIDEAKRAEQLLRQSEERFARIFQLLPYPMGLTRRSDGQYMDVNTAWEDALGFTREEALGKTAVGLGIYTPQQRARLMEAVTPDGQLISYEAVLAVRSGEQRTVLQSMRATNFDGQDCWLFALHDISERKRAEEWVREREELLSLTISAAALGLWDWNLQTGTVTGDARWHAMRGAPAASASSPLSWNAAIGADELQRIMAEVTRHSHNTQTPFDATWRTAQGHGGGRWMRSLGKIVRFGDDGQPLRMVGVAMDVTAQTEQEERLQRLAHYDPLTGLPNRVLLAQTMEQAMQQARSSGTLLCVAYLDLDGFKPINDRLGHGAGDRLLVMVATRLRHALRAVDCVARLGGDEFVLLLPAMAHGDECERMLQRVMESISAPYLLEPERVSVTASIGYTLYPQDSSDADTLLRHTDQAMYAAKQAGRNRFHQFDAVQERASQQVRAQLVQLKGALAADQFVLYLQPKVDMRLGRVVGAEALVRWQHPERGLLSPAAFLSLLQNTELELGFDAWVVESALGMVRTLLARGLEIPVSINIAAPHLQQPGFSDWMAAQLARHHDISPALLEMEITETAALYNLHQVASTLGALQKMGIRTSLDDFGTGYSSLTYLRRLPLHTLKIDQSFVQGMLGDSGDLAIVQGVIGLARSFGYTVIAEGVETVEQGEKLLQLGCTLAQGYCVARPMPLEAFTDWAATWQAPSAWRSQKLPVLLPVPASSSVPATATGPVPAPALHGTAQYLPDVQPPGGH